MFERQPFDEHCVPSIREVRRSVVTPFLSWRQKCTFSPPTPAWASQTRFAAAREALKREGFSILAEIDMRQVFKRHLSVDLRPYFILSVCNLPLVHRAIEADDAIGSMLLCDMVIQEHGDSCVEFSVVDPACTIGMVNHVVMISIAEELRSLVRKVMDDIESAPKFHRAA